MSLWRVERKAEKGEALTLADIRAFVAEADRSGATDQDRVFGVVSMTAKLRQIAVEIAPTASGGPQDSPR